MSAEDRLFESESWIISGVTYYDDERMTELPCFIHAGLYQGSSDALVLYFGIDRHRGEAQDLLSRPVEPDDVPADAKRLA